MTSLTGTLLSRPKPHRVLLALQGLSHRAWAGFLAHETGVGSSLGIAVRPSRHRASAAGKSKNRTELPTHIVLKIKLASPKRLVASCLKK